MAIITTTTTAPAVISTIHEVAPGAIQEGTTIPRGTALYAGILPVAALVATNQRAVVVNLTFGSSNVFLLKNLTFSYVADTVEENSFVTAGVGKYHLSILDPISSADIGPQFGLESPGSVGVGTTLESTRTWHLVNNWPRTFIHGETGDTMSFHFADPDPGAGGKVAGDLFFFGEFWIYDIEQVKRFPVHNPFPVVCY